MEELCSFGQVRRPLQVLAYFTKLTRRYLVKASHFYEVHNVRVENWGALVDQGIALQDPRQVWRLDRNGGVNDGLLELVEEELCGVTSRPERVDDLG